MTMVAFGPERSPAAPATRLLVRSRSPANTVLVNVGVVSLTLYVGRTRRVRSAETAVATMSNDQPADELRMSAPASAGQRIDLDRYVPAFITFIANKLARSSTALYQKRFGVNVTEWRILSLLVIEPGISASRICLIIGIDKGPVSRTLNVMQARGLITIGADPSDGRTHSISLTPQGLALHDQIIVVALERERRLLACLRKDEQDVLIDLLRRIRGNLETALDAPGATAGD